MEEIKKKWSGLAIKSFIFGLLSWLIPLSLLPLSFIKELQFSRTFDIIAGIANIIMYLSCLLAMLLGIRAIRQIKVNPSQKGKILAIPGIILGSILVLLGIAFIIYVIGFNVVLAFSPKEFQTKPVIIFANIDKDPEKELILLRKSYPGNSYQLIAVKADKNSSASDIRYSGVTGKGQWVIMDLDAKPSDVQIQDIDGDGIPDLTYVIKQEEKQTVTFTISSWHISECTLWFAKGIGDGHFNSPKMIRNNIGENCPQ